MAIGAECDSCQKQFSAPESMAGKSVRCKGCGNIFVIPSLKDDPAGETDLSGWAAMEQTATGGGDDTILSTGNRSFRARPQEPPGTMEFAPDDLPARRPPRRNLPFDFPLSALLDKWLPFLIVIACLSWVAWETYMIPDKGLGRAWLPPLRVAVLLGIYFLVIFPISLKGVRAAATKANVGLPHREGWRTFAVFTLPFALGYVLWLISGSITMLITGCLVGLVFSGLSYWLLFRLRAEEMPVSYGIAAGGFLGGVAAATVLLVGLNLILNTIMQATRSAQTFSGSPLGPYFAWDAPKPPAQKEVEKSKSTTMASAVDNVSPDQGENGTSPIQPGDNPSLFTDPDATTREAIVDSIEAPVVVVVPSADPPPSVPGDTGIIPPDPSDEPSDLDPPPSIVNKSPIVADIISGSEIGAFEEILFPATANKWMAVVKEHGAEEDLIERWTTQPLAAKESTVFGREQEEISGEYAISPAGDLLVRIASWPTLSAQVWSFDENKVTRTITLDKKYGEANLIGFFNSDRFVIHRRSGEKSGIEIWDARTGLAGKTSNTPDFVDSTRVSDISPDGRFLALALPVQEGDTRKGYMELYSMVTGKPMIRIPITQMDWSQGAMPVGVAFSPDSTNIAVLFEENRQGLLLCWSLSIPNAQLVANHLYPAGIAANAGERPAGGRVFDWLGDGQGWLLYGASVYDFKSGRLLGEIGLSDVISQRVIDKETCALIHKGSNGQAELKIIKLNKEELAARRAK